MPQGVRDQFGDIQHDRVDGISADGRIKGFKERAGPFAGFCDGRWSSC